MSRILCSLISLWPGGCLFACQIALSYNAHSVHFIILLGADGLVLFQENAYVLCGFTQTEHIFLYADGNYSEYI